MEEANLLYAYHTDSEGNIVYGETGAPEIIRPSEGRSVEADRKLWNHLVGFTGKEELKKYQLTVTASIPELLSFIDETNRSRFEEQFAGIFAQTVLSRQAEFEALLAREERLFVARRTGDLLSLRKQSENQSAKMLVSQLIREAESSCAAGIALLEEKIEAAHAGSGDLALAGEEWLAVFQEQFGRGLKAWADAEEHFLVRRMEWERDSSDRYFEGEEIWKTAFAELEKERMAWEEKSRELFTAGEQLFIDASEKLNIAIYEAREEFKKDAALRVYSGCDRAKAWVDMYITCASVLTEAKTNINFWLPRFVPDVPANVSENGTLETWVNKTMLENSLTDTQIIAGNELIRWAGIYTQYKTKAVESLEILEMEFGLMLGMDKNALNTVLDFDSEEFFLDEYQTELLRAKVIAAYWEQRFAIAEAVSKYAEDLSAGRMTEAESLIEWRNAKTRYEAALTAYADSQDKLKTAGNDLAAAQTELKNIAAQLAVEEKNLDKLSKDYALQITAYQSNLRDPFLIELASCYRSLMELSENRTQDSAYYTAYLKAEIKYMEEHILIDGWNLLENIVDPNINPEIDPELKRLQLSFLCSFSSLDWYYAVTGKEETTDDRKALEAEGLLNRLKREVEEEAVQKEDIEEFDEEFDEELAEIKTSIGTAQQRLSVYRDLIFYAPGLQKEAAEYAWRSLNNVYMEFGIDVPSGVLPDITSLTDQLLKYSLEKELSPGIVIASFLTKIDVVTETLPIMLDTEFSVWEEALINYLAVKVLYRGITVTEDINLTFEKYQSLFDDISARIEDGNISESDILEFSIYQYLLEFLIKHDDSKKAFEDELNKDSEHWRMYVSSPYFDDYTMKNPLGLSAAIAGDPESSLSFKGALSREEGLFADAYEEALEANRRMSAALEIFLNSGISQRQTEFVSAVESFLSSPEKFRDYAINENEYNMASYLYQDEKEKLHNNMLIEYSLKKDIAGLGWKYFAPMPSEQESLDLLKSLSMVIEQTRNNHDDILKEYKNKAAIFAEAGDSYESLYMNTKKMFSYLDAARIEYEKQDAIQRWAGTSYLSKGSELPDDLQYYREPSEELDYTRERNDRAQIALAALQDIYNNGETSREFADTGYMQLYKEYRESFSAMFLALKAITEYSVDLQVEQQRNLELYAALSSNTYEFWPELYSFHYDNYETPQFSDISWLDYIYITESGGLGILRNKNSFGIEQVTQDEAVKLSEYFNPVSFYGDGTSQMSEFETFLDSWSARMDTYNLGNMNNYQNWGLALDYVIRKLAENNPAIGQKMGIYIPPDSQIDELHLIEFLAKYANIKNPAIGTTIGIFGAAEMGSDGQLKLNGNTLENDISFYHQYYLPNGQLQAWNSLSNQQKEDLEFLAVMILNGGGGEGSKGFTNVTKYHELDLLKNNADSYVYTVNLLFTKKTAYRYPYIFDHSGLNQVRNAAGNRRAAYYNLINSEKSLFSQFISKSKSDLEAYKESCDRLVFLCQKQEEGIDWTNIEEILCLIEAIDKSEIDALENQWEKMIEQQQNSGGNILYTSIGSALNALYIWSYRTRTALEQNFEFAYFTNEQNRIEHQNEYRKTLDTYINGECSIADLRNAAELTFGPETAAIKNHLYNLGTALLSDLKTINTNHDIYLQPYRVLGEQYISLIEQAYNTRYGAELSARETEWNEQLKDLNKKKAAWQEASGLILARGRQDWINGYESMQAAFSKWKQDFQDQYTAVDTAWNAAYLESLQGKELWINQAMIASNDAFNNSLLTLLGSDAESESRKLDIFMPSSLPGSGAAEEAALVLQKVLDSAGIASLFNAANSITGSVNTALTTTRRGVSGLGVWNSAQAQAIAKESAWNSTNELAKGKMVQLAFSARESAYEAKKDFEDRIVQANSNTDNFMDELYLLTGGWNRSGNKYSKDIIVHSTVFTSAITDKVVLDAYKWFVMEYWDFAADLSDSNLESLDYQGIQYLVGLAQKEIQEKHISVFGNEKQKGDFFIWLGEYDNEDKRSGEYGRMLYDFTKWEDKQAQGIAAMNTAIWDKPLWDSRDSWFDAPNIRSVVDMATSVVATVVGAVLSPFTAGGSLALAYGINMSDDLFFSALDAGYGYKSWSEAGFEFGKKSLITAVTTAGGTAFNGIGTVSSGGFAGLTAKAVGNTSGLTSTIITTGMGAAQTFAAGTVTSAINAINYNDGKFGWSSGAFGKGMVETAKGAAVGGVTTFTGGALNLGLEGLYGQYYNNGNKLSSLIGGLTGQGLNYAMGGDFTLNVFNLNFLNESLASSGLLELHFGRDGITSNLGSGGVDASMGTLISAYKGLDAWKLNYDIWTSDSDDAKNYIIGMRSLYSGSEENKALFNSVLNNETNIVENKNADYTKTIKNNDGTNTIHLGSDALSDGSRFGLSVVLSHESYRDGVDGTVEQQRLETDQAVMGHVNTALGLMATYGAGCISSGMAGEAVDFSNKYAVLMSENTSAREKIQAMKEIYGLLDSYDSNADYWKLVKQNGQWGWEADGTLTFNFDLRNPEIMEAYYNAGAFELIGFTGKLSAENLTNSFLYILGTTLGINTYRGSNELSNFINGSLKFADASIAAIKLKNNLSQQNINEFNMALMDVQNSGLLIRKPVVQASYLKGKGTEDNPYLPLTGIVTLTCLEGYRFVTEKSFTPSATYPLNDFAEAYHNGVDMVSSLYNVVSSTDGSLQYTYDKTYGLRGFLTSNSENFTYISSHLAGDSVVNYINVFGMGNASLIYNDNGTYSLTGIKAGVTIGTMGSTGYSTGAHVDFIIKNSTGKVQPFSAVFENQYNNLRKTNWAVDFSGLPEKKPNDAIEKYLEAQRQKQLATTITVPD
ncbi:MAG: hypothetical protein LBB72_04030 [Spirochaetaceae bacterium]|nr:hypothetical protein [Spirochaetaceae bacterium]